MVKSSKNMGMNLFDGSDEIDLSKIETDPDFARRYEHNKRREAMHKIEELKKKGLVEDSEESSSEDEEDDVEDVVGSSKNESKFVDALLIVKKRDPIIKEKDLKLFESEDEESEQEKDNGNKKEKPMYLKDVVAMHLIEEGADFEEKETMKTYRQEQDEFREAFLSAVQEPCDDDDGDLLMEKKKRKGGDEEGHANSDEVPRKLDEYFGEDEGLDENQMFLKKFFRNKMWIDKKKGNKLANDNLLEVYEDEEEIEKQEKFEAEYNFRYEEGAGDRVLGHARFTEGSVRKKTSARKIQRKSKEERMALAEFERKEEVKHLKNLKKKEIKEMIDKIRTIADIREGAVCALNEKYLEEDFDPEEYDKKMNETFNDDYYEIEDDIPVYGSEDDDDLEKPDFDKEYEMLGLPKDWDVVVPGDGFAKVREKVLKAKANKKEIESSGSDGNDGDEQKVDDLPEEGKRKRKREIPLREKVLDKYWEDYHKLDYEGTIGDLKTRFPYISVPSQRFGLNAVEILMTDDKELNQRVPLKKIAPYTEKEYIPVKSHHPKTRHKLVPQGVDLDVRRCSNGDMQTTSLEANKIEQDSVDVRELNGDAVNKSRRRKRRERQAELKPSQGRLVAYGKIPAKSKNKKKHKTGV